MRDRGYQAGTLPAQAGLMGIMTHFGRVPGAMISTGSAKGTCSSLGGGEALAEVSAKTHASRSGADSKTAEAGFQRCRAGGAMRAG